MSTNWGNAQFNKAPYTNGAGVQQNGVVKLWHYRRSYLGSSLEPSLAPAYDISTLAVNTYDIEWCSTKSPEYARNTSLAEAGPGILILPRPNTFVKVRLNMQGVFVADWDEESARPNPALNIRCRPQLGTAAIESLAAEPVLNDNFWVNNRDTAAGTIPQFTLPFSFDATWCIPLKSVGSNYPSVFNIPRSEINQHLLVMQFSFAQAGVDALLSDANVIIRSIESTVEQYQNVSFHNEQIRI